MQVATGWSAVAAAITWTNGWALLPVQWLLLFSLALLVGTVVWVRRERRMARQRRNLRALMALAEDVVSASNQNDISRAVTSVIPETLGASDAEMFLLDRAKNMLVPVRVEAHDTAPLSINSPIGGLTSAIALSFRNRALFVVPDTRHSPLFRPNEPDLPASCTFVPMMDRNEAVGVLSIVFRHRREISKDEQTAIQHVANQIATSLRLQQQSIMREQLLRTEKMAATGQLISGVATELRVPLQAIQSVAHELIAGNGRQSSDLRSIAHEADRAAAILSRLVSIGDDHGGSENVDVGALLRTAVSFRAREWTARRIDSEIHVGEEPLLVYGVASQLDQVLLNLLLSAEHAVIDQPEQRLLIEATQEDATVLLTIEFTGPADAAVTSSGAEAGVPGALGMQVCQAILDSHGGEFRLRNISSQRFRFEVELPAAHGSPKPSAGPENQARPATMLTALIIEPDLTMQRGVMAQLSERGHRSVPVPTAEDGIDMSHRLKFDVVFCSAQLAGMNWAEFHNRVKRAIPTFVLLSEGYDPSLSKSFKPGEGYIVNRALAHEEIERVLLAVEAGQAATARR